MAGKKKAKLSPAEVEKVAELARLPISEKEKKIYSEQLSRILEAFEELVSCQTDNVEPTFNVTSLENVMREDLVAPSLSQRAALSNAPRKKNGLFVTKGVMGRDV